LRAKTLENSRFVYIELQPQDNAEIERLVSALEAAETESPESVVRKGRAIAAARAMSYAQSARLGLLVAAAFERTRRPIEAIDAIRPRLREADGGTARYWRGRVGSFLANLYLTHFVETDLCVKLLEDAAADFQAARERQWVGATLTMLGVTYRANADLPQALDNFRRAYSAFGAEISPLQHCSVATSIALCCIELDRYQEADDALAPLLPLVANMQIADRESQVLVHGLIGVTKTAQKAKKLADHHLAIAQTQAEATAERFTRTYMEFCLGRVHEISGKWQRAADHYVRAAQLCTDGGMQLQLFDMLRAQIRLGKSSGNFGAALGAMEALERVQRRLQIERSKIKLLDFDSQRNFDSANEFAQRLQREVEQKTRVLGDTVKRLQDEATHRAASEQRSEYLSAHDLVTGLASRRRLLPLAQERISTLASDTACALVMIGIEPPSGLSETVGATGIDALLSALAEELQQNAPGAILGRFSDWRFVCITAPTRAAEATAAAVELSEILCQAMSMPHVVEGINVSVKVAAGIAQVTAHSADIMNTLSNAEAALEQALTQYANRTHVFDERLETKKTRVRTLRAALPALNEHSGLYMCFQPLVSASKGDVRGFESLVRWKHPQLGMVSPAEFIPMAEALTLMEPLGLEIARLAMRDFVAELRPVFASAYLSINVSMLQLRDPHFSSNLRQVCRDQSVSPTEVLLEITESQFIAGDDTVEANLRRLREIGFRFAIDDFGTGYSSLWRLSQLDVNTIKVARELVVAATQTEQGKMLLHRAVQICRDLDRVVVAEGIEGQAERACAQAAGCDQLQGYMFSRPQTAKDLLATLASSIDIVH
jgi:diguanylate cyclase (GGDEF)-like protein